MKQLFFFFNLELPDLEEELDPIYATSVSEIEEHLRRKGIEILDMWKETLEENDLYSGYFMGFEYRYGFVVEEDKLIFLFTVPASLKKLSYYPVRVQRRIEEKLIKGFATREFSRLGVVQFAELIDSHLYVATEW